MQGQAKKAEAGNEGGKDGEHQGESSRASLFLVVVVQLLIEKEILERASWTSSSVSFDFAPYAWHLPATPSLMGSPASILFQAGIWGQMGSCSEL
jgi:hypothetical protein